MHPRLRVPAPVPRALPTSGPRPRPSSDRWPVDTTVWLFLPDPGEVLVEEGGQEAGELPVLLNRRLTLGTRLRTVRLLRLSKGVERFEETRETEVAPSDAISHFARVLGVPPRARRTRTSWAPNRALVAPADRRRPRDQVACAAASSPAYPRDAPVEIRP